MKLGTALEIISNRSVLQWDIALVRSLLQLLINTNALRNSMIRFTLMMDATRSSETSVLSKSTRRHIPGDGILHLAGF
jgi:hypothetical protein